MKTRYIQHPETLELIPADQFTYEAPAGPAVIPDIGVYRSMVNGQMIEGRRQHREHLKQHGVVEVGNDLDSARPKAHSPPGGLKEAIASQVYAKLRY